MKMSSYALFQSKDEAAEQLNVSKNLALSMMFEGFLTDLRKSLIPKKKIDLIQHLQ